MRGVRAISPGDCLHKPDLCLADAQLRAVGLRASAACGAGAHRVGCTQTARFSPSNASPCFEKFQSEVPSLPTCSAVSIRRKVEPIDGDVDRVPDSAFAPVRRHISPSAVYAPHCFLFRRLFSSLSSTLALPRSARPASAASHLSPREFRRQSLKLQRQSTLFAHFADLPYVSWRSLLRLLHLLSAKPALVRGEDLRALPLVCKRLGVSDFRIVDRVLAGAVVRPSSKFSSPFGVVGSETVNEANLRAGESHPAAPSSEQSARAHAKVRAGQKRPSFSLFVASLDDWQVRQHPHHLHALQRLLAAICANLHNYTAPDLLLLLDGLTARRTGQDGDDVDVDQRKFLKRGLGHVPVEALEEFEVTLGLLLLQVRARLCTKHTAASRGTEEERDHAGEGLFRQGEAPLDLRGVIKAYEIVSRAAAAPPESWTSSFFLDARVRADSGAAGAPQRATAEPAEGQLTLQRRAFAKFLTAFPADKVGEEREVCAPRIRSPIDAVEDLLSRFGARILAGDSASTALDKDVARDAVSTAAVDAVFLVQASSVVAGSQASRLTASGTPASMLSGPAVSLGAAAMAQEILQRVAAKRLPVEKDGKTYWCSARELLSSEVSEDVRQALLRACASAPPSVIPSFAGAVSRDFQTDFRGARHLGMTANPHVPRFFRGVSTPDALTVSVPTLAAALPLFSRCAVLAVTLPHAGVRKTGRQMEESNAVRSFQGRKRLREARSLSTENPSPHLPAACEMHRTPREGVDALVSLRRLSSVVELTLDRQMQRMGDRDGVSDQGAPSDGERETSTTRCSPSPGKGEGPDLNIAVEVFCAADVGARLSRSLLERTLYDRRYCSRSSLRRPSILADARRFRTASSRSAFSCLERGAQKQRRPNRGTAYRIVASLHRRFELCRRLAELHLQQAVEEAGPLLSDASLARIVAQANASRSANEIETVNSGSGHPTPLDPRFPVGDGKREKNSQLFRSERQSIHDWLVPHVIRVCPLHMSALYFQLLVGEFAARCWQTGCGLAAGRSRWKHAVGCESGFVKDSRAADASGSEGVRVALGSRESAEESQLPQSSLNASVGDGLSVHALRIACHVRQRLDGIRRQLERQCRLSEAQQERVLISLPQFQQHNEELILRDTDLDFTPFGKLFNLREPRCGVRTSRDVLALIKVTNQHVSRAMACVATLRSSLELLLGPLQDDGDSDPSANSDGGISIPGGQNSEEAPVTRRAVGCLRAAAPEDEEDQLRREEATCTRGRRRDGCREVEAKEIRDRIRKRCHELQKLTEALARSSRRCLYTVIVQMPVRRKAWLGPCQGEVEWATQQALAMLAADTASDQREVSGMLESPEKGEGRLGSAAKSDAVQDVAPEHAAGSGLAGSHEKTTGRGTADGNPTLSRMVEMKAIIERLQPETGIVAWDLRNPPRVVTARGRGGLGGDRHRRWRSVEHSLGENEMLVADGSFVGAVPGIFTRLGRKQKSEAAAPAKEQHQEQSGHALQSAVNGESETPTATVTGKRDRFMVQAGAN
ncbi:conserved hypothetical protein [Neospora caninum Liverpool]|uniref:Uncharacterized protein n=1 Tax=Neospora caninum (strain Liverpool) TaxID=572307 RepID=F0V913_NEOCL|nr:conserved hypothetical protein [Neospora caninum Liverpool]CBZ50204.1 conserved hypothetical protein [Neospora caninum Liverpool]|eukprot:XP_003880239.1 conserved hypothetical protein [Neospora caninum Liverpool]